MTDIVEEVTSIEKIEDRLVMIPIIQYKSL